MVVEGGDRIISAAMAVHNAIGAGYKEIGPYRSTWCGTMDSTDRSDE
jgi:hypothetical protein